MACRAPPRVQTVNPSPQGATSRELRACLQHFPSYYEFTRRWGTHVLNTLTTGSRIALLAFAKTSSRVNEDALQASLCASYDNSTLLSVKGCKGFNYSSGSIQVRPPRTHTCMEAALSVGRFN